MRKKIIAANWKMNKTFEEANLLIEEIGMGLKERELENKEVIVCPPFLFIELVTDFSQDFPFNVGVQNISEHKSGAYTGEISAGMVKSTGTDYAIIGHSERRNLYNETDDVLAGKVHQAVINSIKPIFCCGELLEDRKKGNHFDVVKTQLEDGLFDIDKEDMKNVVIAYEPVWAIGTGETATPEQAQEMHQFIRKLIVTNYNQEIADQVPILYGGSVKPNNAKELFSMPDIDGGLIGGASLQSEDFLAIVDAAE